MTPEHDDQQDEAKFLALLVHRGHIDRSQAEPLLKPLKGGAPLDDLLQSALGWSAEKVRRLRRTRGGEEPEIAGLEILGRLGIGGTAEVFRAREKKSGRAVAVKILNPQTAADPRQLKAFVQEARVLQTLDHSGLVRGFGVNKTGGQEEGITYFSRLELVEGRTLEEFLDEGQVFDEPQALQIILEVAEVLAYMASKGLVHRDVKPGNIMLTDSGRAKLIDLGFCAEQDQRNAEDSSSGTVGFLAPEQAEGGASADIRSDIYSLGATLFQLTIGRLPFQGDCDEETMRMAVMESLKSPELKSKAFSPHLHFIIEKMMAKEAAVRFQSWEEFIGEVREQVLGRERLDFSKTVLDRSSVSRRPPRRRGGERG